MSTGKYALCQTGVPAGLSAAAAPVRLTGWRQANWRWWMMKA